MALSIQSNVGSLKAAMAMAEKSAQRISSGQRTATPNQEVAAPNVGGASKTRNYEATKLSSASTSAYGGTSDSPQNVVDDMKKLAASVAANPGNSGNIQQAAPSNKMANLAANIAKQAPKSQAQAAPARSLNLMDSKSVQNTVATKASNQAPPPQAQATTGYALNLLA